MIRFKLNELIKQKGLDESGGVSNRQLAREIGVSHVTLYKLRANLPFNATVALIDRLCSFFKCKVGDLLEYSNKQKKRGHKR